ncbi:hypothetical protein GQ602_007242 [Ophiocordyceps camponoti-floridani]|uniref:Uncharacterized protein n=1 Tax=Ophiocordyceps camponoti-floridani TaxID=2030778 RepID=A0A8H4VAV7_9HYPO|nr:hypothetical protein GQ602_007242 [Ophiocordyceps camponoti-floridani]
MMTQPRLALKDLPASVLETNLYTPLFSSFLPAIITTSIWEPTQLESLSIHLPLAHDREKTEIFVHSCARL